MEMVLNRPVIVLAVLASLVAVLLRGLGGGEPVRAPGAIGADGEAASGGPARMAPAIAAPRRGQASTPAGRAATAPQAPATRAAQRRASLGEAFENADDLYVFLQSVLPAAAAGDADAAWMASRVYDYCAAHAMDPAAYARDTDAMARMHLDSPASMVRARQKVGHRCRHFGPGEGIDRDLVILQRLKAV